MGIEFDRSTTTQIAAGVASILVFIVLAVAVGRGNGAEALEPAEGLAMVAVLAFFVVFTGVLGLALSDRLTAD